MSYLSPEPLLQSPVYVRQMAQGGLSVATYAYALNNPLSYVDRDGLAPDWSTSWDRRADTIAKERAHDRSLPARRAYDMWWANRPERFRTWGPFSNAKRYFGDRAAPVCKQYGEAAAEAINAELRDGEGSARSLWDWQADDGTPRGPVTPPSHDNVRVFDASGRQIDTYDPWWRLW